MPGPDRALQLPAEVWQRPVQLATPVSGACIGARQQVKRAMLVARLASTCRTLRDAVEGADELWKTMYLSRSYTRLSQAQAKGLNKALFKQANLARVVGLRGEDWDLAELHALVSRFTRLDHLWLFWVRSPAEALIMAAAGSGQPVALSLLECSALTSFPASVQCLTLRMLPKPPDDLTLYPSTQERLRLMQPLSGLHSLALQLDGWRLTAADSQNFVRWHPSLHRLCLALTAEHVAEHAAHQLSSLSCLRASTHLHLVLTKKVSLMFLLQQLQALTPEVLVIQAQEFSYMEEMLLSQCTIRRLCVLIFSQPDRGLEHLPQVPELQYFTSCPTSPNRVLMYADSL